MPSAKPAADIGSATPSSNPLETIPAPAPDGQPGLIQAAAILAIGNVASRILGLARETVKARLFGATGLLSAFEIAAYVPVSLYDLLVGGMVSSALVPVFSDFTSPDKRKELWPLLSTVLSVAAAVLALVTAVVVLLAPQIAWVVGANEFDDPSLTTVTVQLMRLSAATVLFLGLASILSGALYALRRFTLPAFVGAAFNGTIVVVALARPDHISSLAWGLLLGSMLQIVILLPALRGFELRWQPNWRHPAIRRIGYLYAPILAGLVINQAAIAFSYNLATRTGDQSVSYMKFATTLYQFPLGLVVTALSIATLPTLARLADELADFQRTLAEGLRLVIVLILPAAFGLFALAAPIVALLFEGDRFTAADTVTTALVLRYYLIGLPFAAVDQMLVFASYARKDTWRPAFVGVISILIYSLVAIVLLEPLGLLSLMVADAVKHIVHMALMLWLLHRYVGGLGGHGILATMARSLLASTLVAMAAYYSARAATSLLPGVGKAQQLLIVAAAGMAGLAVFVAAAYVLDIKQARELKQLLRRGKES